MAEQPAQKEYKTVDIVDFAMQSKPTKVNDAFGHLISNKVVDSLASRKQEVSAKMFADKVEEPTSEPEAETTEEQ
tara:strand:- start:102 stop:326 length:225 start_codon:yes stop_codon:yes gene_type:complete